MTDAQIIEGLGAGTDLADRMGVQRSTISKWKIRGIPRHAKATLALLFPGKVPESWRPAKASRKRK